jgi:hypothetical protein
MKKIIISILFINFFSFSMQEIFCFVPKKYFSFLRKISQRRRDYLTGQPKDIKVLLCNSIIEVSPNYNTAIENHNALKITNKTWQSFFDSEHIFNYFFEKIMTHFDIDARKKAMIAITLNPKFADQWLEKNEFKKDHKACLNAINEINKKTYPDDSHSYAKINTLLKSKINVYDRPDKNVPITYIDLFLFNAINAEKKYVVDLLISYGTRLNHVYPHYNFHTPLTYAVSQNVSDNMLAVLLNSDIDINKPVGDGSKQTALMLLCTRKDLDYITLLKIKKLLKYKANTRLRDRNNLTTAQLLFQNKDPWYDLARKEILRMFSEQEKIIRGEFSLKELSDLYKLELTLDGSEC